MEEERPMYRVDRSKYKKEEPLIDGWTILSCLVIVGIAIAVYYTYG